MTRTYCTIFDKNYLYQGVALYQSLKSHTDGFNLYALCMDETAYSLIKSMDLKGLIAVHVEDILTATLERVQGRTTKGQFCWVCQPIICQHVLANFNENSDLSKFKKRGFVKDRLNLMLSDNLINKDMKITPKGINLLKFSNLLSNIFFREND